MLKESELKVATEKNRKEELLKKLAFIRLTGGPVQLGTTSPVPCRLEGYRRNEGPVRVVEVKPFWICRFKVTNKFFEEFDPNHSRPPQAPGNNHPVVDVTYGEAIRFINFINHRYGMEFRLPSEPEWTFAAAPRGWEYPHGQTPNFKAGHVYGDGHEFGTAPVDDPRWPKNFYGLDQIGYNVSEIVGGYYYAPGHLGAETDGAYCIIKGGNFGHCKRGPRLATRAIFDVADRNPRVGFRLAHNDI